MKISTLQKGLVGHWFFNEESFNPATKRFTDKTPQSNHGTGNGTQLGGSPSFAADRMGQANMAAPFNGTDDYIDLPDGIFPSGNNPRTFALWLYRGSLDTGCFLRYGDGGTAGKDFMARVGRDADHDISVDFTWQRYGTIGNVLSINTWHFVELVVPDGATQTDDVLFYVDCELKAATNKAGAAQTLDTAAQSEVIGDSGEGSWWNGRIAELRVYNRALSQAERVTLYNQYRSRLAI